MIGKGLLTKHIKIYPKCQGSQSHKNSLSTGSSFYSQHSIKAVSKSAPLPLDTVPTASTANAEVSKVKRQEEEKTLRNLTYK